MNVGSAPSRRDMPPEESKEAMSHRAVKAIEHDSTVDDPRTSPDPTDGPQEIKSPGNNTRKFQTSLERFVHIDNPDNGAVLNRTRKRSPVEPIIATSLSPVKRSRKSSSYAPPSKYAHLPKLVDTLEPDLICVFIGLNPGIQTATTGHPYAHPSNQFWKLLHSSGCTDVRLRPQQHVDLPRLYSMGNTNIVERPSRDGGELSKAEVAAGTPVLEQKIQTFRPEAVCLVGKGIWEAIWRWRHGREMRKDEFKYGWQDGRHRMGRTDGWAGALIFVATSTSGLAATLRPHEKQAIWEPFGQWVARRRSERGEEAGKVATK